MSTALQQGLDALAPRLRTGGSGVSSLQRMSGGASQETWSFVVHAEGAGRPADGAAARARRRGRARGRQCHAGRRSADHRAGVARPACRCPRCRWCCSRPWAWARAMSCSTWLARRSAGASSARPGWPARAPRLARQCGRALARIHAIDTARLPPLRRAPARRRNWPTTRRGTAATRTARPVFELALQWLKRHRPPDPARLSLVHGDFRNGNLVVDEGGLRAVLDWEMAHLGDPMEDLGWICVNSWRFGAARAAGGRLRHARGALRRLCRSRRHAACRARALLGGVRHAEVGRDLRGHGAGLPQRRRTQRGTCGHRPARVGDRDRPAVPAGALAEGPA